MIGEIGDKTTSQGGLLPKASFGQVPPAKPKTDQACEERNEQNRTSACVLQNL